MLHVGGFSNQSFVGVCGSSQATMSTPARSISYLPSRANSIFLLILEPASNRFEVLVNLLLEPFAQGFVLFVETSIAVSLPI